MTFSLYVAFIALGLDWGWIGLVWFGFYLSFLIHPSTQECTCRVKFATSLDEKVYIQREGCCNVVISPENAAAFVKDMQVIMAVMYVNVCMCAYMCMCVCVHMSVHIPRASLSL